MTEINESVIAAANLVKDQGNALLAGADFIFLIKIYNLLLLRIKILSSGGEIH